MIDKASKQDRFDSKYALYAVIGVIIVFLPIVISGSDIGEILYILSVAIISLCLLAFVLVTAIRRKSLRSLSIFLALVTCWAVSWVLATSSINVRSTTRWMFRSKIYKAEVMDQPGSPEGGIRHIEWDSWGMAGQDTIMYLVFDPNNSLDLAAKSRASGKAVGLPCDVWKVHRLENHWYSVVFYTNTGWGQFGC